MSDIVIPLSDRSYRFCELYCVYFDVAKAEEGAGLLPGSGRTILADPRAKAVIAEKRRQWSDELDVSHASVLNQLTVFMRVSVADYFDDMPGGGRRIKPLASWTADMRAAVKGLKETRFGPALELHSKIDAITLLGRYFGLWNDKLELSGKVSLVPQIVPEMSLAEAAAAYQMQIEHAA